MSHSPSPTPNLASTSAPPLLEVRGVSKAFPGIQALSGVHLTLRAGEVLCVVGENGAGKSTLMKIVAGVNTSDSGEILIDGQPAQLRSVQDAQAAGVTLIHQELNLAPTLDVAGNIFLGREPRWGGPLRLLDRRMVDQAEAIMRRVGLATSGRTSVESLSIGQQQLVEIARSLSLQSRVLIMDEPTSSLSQRDTERLFAVISDLKASGVGILYISHRLPEVRQIADRVTVLRDGRNAGELRREEISHEALVRLMIGREVKQFFVRSAAKQGEQKNAPAAATASSENKAGRSAPPALQVAGLRVTAGQRRPIDFEIRRGEIVGLAGLVGAGRTELAEALFGVRRAVAGEIRVDGKLIRVRHPQNAIRAGLLLAPEDRRLQGLFLEQSVRRNISLPSLLKVSRLRLVKRRAEIELAERVCRQLSVRTVGVEKEVGLLSGGNQQKVVLGRWLCREPRLLILDEPTRGVDVGAKSEIYAIMDELTTRGVGVLMISSDLEEILGMSDRVLVMHQGEMAGELQKTEFSEQAVMNLATGGAAAAK
ncbi:MAG TPA: sugar ABC transporter ATP-binding protein [Pirellulales bacterium]